MTWQWVTLILGVIWACVFWTVGLGYFNRFGYIEREKLRGYSDQDDA